MGSCPDSWVILFTMTLVIFDNEFILPAKEIGASLQLFTTRILSSGTASNTVSLFMLITVCYLFSKSSKLLTGSDWNYLCVSGAKLRKNLQFTLVCYSLLALVHSVGLFCSRICCCLFYFLKAAVWVFSTLQCFCCSQMVVSIFH